MPNLSTTLHLDMLRASKRTHAFPRRLARALKKSFQPSIYGTEWGDLEDVPPLKYVLEHWVRPFINADHDGLEIGPGGGRWTRHLLGFRQLYAVDYHEELLRELERNFKRERIIFVKNNGDDFPGIPERSIDFCFSFGTFVHLDLPIIEAYLTHLRPLMKGGGNVVLQYSDKNKIMAQANEGFSFNTPEIMRRTVLTHGYAVLEEDTTTLWHSSLIRFTTD
jgi:Methyltransferase domain